MSEAQKPSSASRKAYTEIRDNIIQCIYKPGAVLNERQLAEQLHISRTPIREALYKLEIEGLIKKYPNLGMMVSEITVKDVRESFEVRKLIEPYATELATKNANINDLTSLLRRFEDILNRPKIIDHHEYYITDYEFHNLIIKSTENNMLIDIIDRMYIFIERLRWIDTNIRFEEGIQEHKEIIKAMLEHNADQARNLMFEHLNNTGNSLIRAIS